MTFRCRIANFVLNYDILFDPFLDLSALLLVDINAVENRLIMIDRERVLSVFENDYIVFRSRICYRK